MTIISTSVSETTETVSGIGGNLVVTSSGSIVNDNGDDGIDTTNTEQVILGETASSTASVTEPAPASISAPERRIPLRQWTG